MDGPTLAKMFRAEARAAEAIQKNPEKFAHYIVEEAGGLIGLKDLKLARILNAPPVPYTRERFDDNYNWTLGWGLVPPGATTRIPWITAPGSNPWGSSVAAPTQSRRRLHVRVATAYGSGISSKLWHRRNIPSTNCTAGRVS
jgi:hypothetical protein